MNLTTDQARTLMFWSRHFPGCALLTADADPVPLTWVAEQLHREGVQVTGADGRLRFTPAPSHLARTALVAHRDLLLALHHAYLADSRAQPLACTSCHQVVLTTLRQRTKDRRKYRGGPDCRMTPGCPGRHEHPVVIPWADQPMNRRKSA